MRAYCDTCGLALSLDADGRMPSHFAVMRIQCPGSGQTPARSNVLPEDTHIARRRPLMPLDERKYSGQCDIWPGKVGA